MALWSQSRSVFSTEEACHGGHLVTCDPMESHTVYGSSRKLLKPSQCFSIYHQNTQCFYNKTTEFEVVFSSLGSNVLCLSEHWCVFDEVLSLKLAGYRLVDHFSRQVHKHGGVALYCMSHLEMQSVPEIKQYSMEFHFECAAGKASFGDMQFVILVLYRSPTSGDTGVFIDQLEKVISILSNKYKSSHIIICGDFNYNFLVPSHSLNTLLDLLDSYNLQPSIKEPTRGNNCLDNIFLSTSSLLFNVTVTHTGLSDHAGQHLVIDFGGRNSSHEYFTRDTKNVGKMLLFKGMLGCVDWDMLIGATSDVEEEYSSFIDNIMYIFNLSFPLLKRKFYKTNRCQPWITAGIRISSRTLKDLHHLKDINSNFDNYYVEYKKIYTRVVKQAKRLYYSDRMKKSENRNKTAWEIIGSDKKCISKGKIKLNVNETYVTDSLECAEMFNSHFNTLQHAFPQNLNACDIALGINHSTNSFFFKPITSHDIFIEIFKLKSSNSSGYDNINSTLLKFCADEISMPLSKIINNSISSGHFPSMLKIVKCIPLFKSGDSSAVDNYRLLSISSTFSKIIERVVSVQFIDYFNRNNLLNDAQHGFRKNRSTSTACCQFLNHLYSSLDKGEASLGLFLDLSKAFDLVNHELLLRKLELYGIRGIGLNWVRSFLVDRKQYVEVGGMKSETVEVRRGVPQGSVLGPFLYIVYTSDIRLDNIIMYADDTSVVVRGQNFQCLSGLANQQLAELTKYFTNNDLYINYSKTKYMQFSLSGHNLDVSHWLHLNKTSIKRTTIMSFLGVKFDEGLNFDAHIDYVCRRIGPMCYVLRQLRDIVDLGTLRMYYFGNVHATISYGISVWGSSSATKRVLIMQKRAVRSMMGVGPMISCRDLFRRLNIMTIVGIYIYRSILNIKENFHMYKKLGSSHDYSTRQVHAIEFPIHRTTSFESSPFYMSIRLFNSLPKHISSLELPAFKMKIRTIIVSKVYYSLSEFYSDVVSW